MHEKTRKTFVPTGKTVVDMCNEKPDTGVKKEGTFQPVPTVYEKILLPLYKKLHKKTKGPKCKKDSKKKKRQLAKRARRRNRKIK